MYVFLSSKYYIFCKSLNCSNLKAIYYRYLAISLKASYSTVCMIEWNCDHSRRIACVACVIRNSFLIPRQKSGGSQFSGTGTNVRRETDGAMDVSDKMG